MAKKKNDDVEFQFNEEYIRRFQAMQEERIAKEHEADELKLQELRKKEEADAIAKANAVDTIKKLYQDHLDRVKYAYQPMHDMLATMGAECKECTRNHYEYD